MFIGTTLAHDAAVAYADVVERRIRFFEMDRFIKVPHFGYLGNVVDAWPKVDRVIRDVPRANVYKAWLFATERLGLTPNQVGFTPIEAVSDECPLARDELALLMDGRVQLLDHQLSHALEVAWRTGLRDGTVVSLDGVGDGCGAVFTVDHDGRLTEVHRRRAASLGELYEYFTRFFLNEGRPCFGREGSFMAFAGLGKPVPIEAGWRTMCAQFAEFNLPWVSDPGRDVVYTWLAKVCGQFNRVDVAHTCQRLWVDTALEYICTWAPVDRPLAFTGGCALNCLLNAELARRWRGDVHWTPTPGDMGQAIGQVLQHLLDRGDDVDAYRLTTVGVYDPHVLSLVSQRLVEVDLDELVARLAAGQVVAVCRGRVEDGPRALGRRSLLASPLARGMHDRLNALKGRAWFRPYGVVLPREHLADLTDLDVDVPWMNVVVNPPAGLLPEAEHVDGSTRVQTMTAEADPWLHDLLTRFGQATGVYALINTSLNTHGRPIFNHYADILPLVGHGVDALVVDDLMLTNKEVGC